MLIRITPWGGSPYHHIVAPAPDGAYSLWLPGLRYELSVKHTHWLRRSIVVELSNGDVENAELHLVNGDAYVDNAVDIKDLNKILYLFTRQDPLADLDEDGVVGLTDLNIVLVNFGIYGDS